MPPESPATRPDARAHVPGKAPVSAEFDARLARVAGSDATVLLVGESGSGKSAAARRLHALGPRPRGPFVEVSLAALAPSLVEAELFGHAEGAFTGAHRTRRGRFERAHGGTLVLDGVETLPGALQVKLLRVLQEHEVEPLGGEAVAVDVRVVATTARDLRAEVAAGRFREDLYFRLAVIPLEVPALRERLEDLPALADEFARRAAARLGTAPRGFTPAALEALRGHAFPGNLRELENAIERVLALAPEGRAPVDAAELAFLAAAPRDALRELARRALVLGVDLPAFEEALIEEAVAAERGNLAAAARRVGLSRKALEYRRRRAAGEARA